MKFIKTPVKGMCDMLPADMRLREHILQMIKTSYAAYGFMQIETPVMEHIENLTSKQGGDNEKLIFKVMKRGADLTRAIEAGKQEFADNGLRYDLTVPLARYYANNKEKLPTPFKALRIGNVWRADNPQKGRFRQFTQCDIDILGDDTNLAEIELIAATSDMLSQIFSEVGITDFTIHINDRQILRAAALQAGFEEEAIGSVLISLDKYDKIGLEGIRRELIENGYAEDVVTRYLAIYESLQGDVTCGDFCSDIAENYLDRKVVEGVDDIISCAKAMINEHVKITFDPTLVRGMGYYTGTIFEISIDGYNFSIAGGGRYDKMIGKFTGQDTPACGFSIGFERVCGILLEQGYQIPGAKQKIALLYTSDVDFPAVLAKAAQLRDTYNVTVLPQAKKLGKQLGQLEASGFAGAAFMDKDEVKIFAQQ